MEILGLLDELRTMACNGLTYATNPYDRERYERLLELTSEGYAEILDLPSEQIRAQLRAEVGYITPKVGADAAIFDEEGRILLHLRADDQCWCLPCGWVDANESPIEAAVREVYEETGLRARPLELVDIFTRKPGRYGNLYTMIAVVYLCEVISGELTLSHEGLDLCYWPIDEVTNWHANHEEYARAAHVRWQRMKGKFEAWGVGRGAWTISFVPCKPAIRHPPSAIRHLPSAICHLLLRNCSVSFCPKHPLGVLELLSAIPQFARRMLNWFCRETPD